jgi:hypothetical protein
MLVAKEYLLCSNAWEYKSVRDQIEEERAKREYV